MSELLSTRPDMFTADQLRLDALPSPTPGDALQDRYRGALVAGAIGDALGRAVETWPAESVRGHFPHGLRDFVPWIGWVRGPRGTVTDDTEMTMLVAEHLLEDDGRLEELALRIRVWGRTGRGIGEATRQALLNYETGHLPAGVRSAGNGTTMRCAPYALAFAGQGELLARQVADGSRLTHDDVTAAAAAVVQAAAVNLCLAAPGELDPHAFLESLIGIFDGVELPALRLRHRTGGFRLTDLLREVHEYVDMEPSAAFAHFHNGAYVMETLPSVLACFLSTRADPEESIVAAVMGGHDADTVAAMVGNLAGALHGTARLPARWLDDLEHGHRLVDLADGLYAQRFGG